jgi:ribose/xylose/arabinose/galactoside ABC-type transport system permease subunit
MDIKMHSIAKKLAYLRREYFILLLLAVIMLLMYAGNSKFFTFYNLQSIIVNNFEIGLISVIMTCVILTGGIDISVGSVVGLAGMVLGICYVQLGISLVGSIALGLLAGSLVGLLNASVIVSLDADPLVVTLGSLVLFRAISRLLTEGWPVSGFPSSFMLLSHGTLLGLGFPIYVFFLSILLAHFVLNRTVAGQNIYSIGNNKDAAYYCGVPVKKTKFIIYLLCGFISAVSGIFLTSRLVTAQTDAGSGVDLQAIAAVVIGGTDIFGGEGTIVGTMLGFLIIAVIKNGCNLMGIDPLVQTIIFGIILIFTIWVNNTLKRRRSWELATLKEEKK